jgi:hypothetical protein
VLPHPPPPVHRKVGTLPVDTKNSTAPDPHPSTSEDHPHVCLEGVVFIGELVEEEGEETEIITSVPCRRCSGLATR